MKVVGACDAIVEGENSISQANIAYITMHATDGGFLSTSTEVLDVFSSVHHAHYPSTMLSSG